MSVTAVIAVFIIALFAAVVFHELGHFVAARRAKVKVEEFGIGIPPRLAGIRRGETVYSINAIPVGAFVRTAGENDPTVPRSLAGKGPWTRLGVYAAGPLANILLAFVLLSTFYTLPVSVITGNGLMVYSVVEGSPAQDAGIEAGDTILQIDGQPVRRWGDVHSMVNSGEQEEVTLLILRDEGEKEIALNPEFDPEEQRWIIGVFLWWNMVAHVEEGSPAYEAGISPGDTIRSINDQPVYNHDSLRDALRSVETAAEMKLVLVRNGDTISTSLANAGQENIPGVDVRWVDGVRIQQERLPVWMAVCQGASFIFHMPAFIIQAIPLIRASPDLALVGPIGAGQLTVEVVRTSGFSSIVFMAGIISLGLGMFNLLPIPPLDGGGMLVAVIEGARRGRRLSPRALRMAYTAGTVFLIALVVMVSLSDILRLVRGEGIGA